MNIKTFAEFAQQLIRECPTNPITTIQDALEFVSIAKSLARLNVQHANTGLTDMQNMRQDELEVRAEAIAGLYLATCEFNGDPRGSAIKLNLKSDTRNNWAGNYSVPQ